MKKRMWKKALCSAMVVAMMASTVPATLQADAAARVADHNYNALMHYAQIIVTIE